MTELQQMTRDEILAMEAGPDLDWRIDELVMGLEVLGMLVVTPDHDAGGYSVPYRQEMHKLDALRPVYVAHCACDLDDRQPSDEDYWDHYAACLEVSLCRSTEIAPAWEVVEKLLSLGFFYEASSGSVGGPGTSISEFAILHEWTFWKHDRHDCCEDSASLAICHAALLAVMGAE